MKKQVAAAFSKQARGFDEYDAGNTIIHYKRNRVREHVLRYLPAAGVTGSAGSILELNAGTGTDAVWFAERGYRVHATDIAEGMQEKLREKVRLRGMEDKVTTELCSFTALDTLRERGPYDLIFSNFAGLNCTGELDRVLRSFLPLLKPGGQVSLVILPGFCLWETLLLFRGKFRTAFRRVFSGRRGVRSNVEGHYFRCWYYSPSYVIRNLEVCVRIVVRRRVVHAGTAIVYRGVCGEASDGIPGIAGVGEQMEGKVAVEAGGRLLYYFVAEKVGG